MINSNVFENRSLTTRFLSILMKPGERENELWTQQQWLQLMKWLESVWWTGFNRRPANADLMSLTLAEC